MSLRDVVKYAVTIFLTVNTTICLGFGVFGEIFASDIVFRFRLFSHILVLAAVSGLSAFAFYSRGDFTARQWAARFALHFPLLFAVLLLLVTRAFRWMELGNAGHIAIIAAVYVVAYALILLYQYYLSAMVAQNLNKVIRMRKKKRLPFEKPYPAIVKLIPPLKIVVVVLILAFGLTCLVGLMLDGALPQWATIASAIAFAATLLAYSIASLVSNRRRERRYKKDIEARRSRVSELEAAGFVPTFKSIGSSRMFMVDENTGKWILIDCFYHPQKAKLHDLSSIVSVSKGKNAEYVPFDQPILMFNGRRLNNKDSGEYFDKTGVVLQLNEKDCPVKFINCFKTENDADIIIGYLQGLLNTRQMPPGA